jgi:hypothetical protein
MKKVLVLFLLSFSIFGFAQKVKLKDNKILIDKVEVYKYSEEGFMTTMSTLSDVEFISIVSATYQERNQLHDPRYTTSSPYITRYVYTVKFLKSGKELTTNLYLKDLALAVYKSNMVDENGNIDDEKLDIFITKYNNENLKLKIN